MLEEEIASILEYTESQGLEDVEIRITRTKTENMSVILWVQGKDRIGVNSISELNSSIREHDNLDWMKWKEK